MSASTTQITAQARNQTGKAAANRLRREGKIPAVAYGHGLASTPLTISPKEILAILKSAAGPNSVVAVKVEGGDAFNAMIADYSYHPVTRSLLHVDLFHVKMDEQVSVKVPLVCHGKAAGIVMGGKLHQVHRTVPLRCLPGQIPLSIDVDVTALEIGDAIRPADLKLAEGISVELAPEQTLVTVTPPEKVRGEAEGEAAAAGAAPDAKDAKKKK